MADYSCQWASWKKSSTRCPSTIGYPNQKQATRNISQHVTRKLVSRLALPCSWIVGFPLRQLRFDSINLSGHAPDLSKEASVNLCLPKKCERKTMSTEGWTERRPKWTVFTASNCRTIIFQNLLYCPNNKKGMEPDSFDDRRDQLWPPGPPRCANVDCNRCSPRLQSRCYGQCCSSFFVGQKYSYINPIQASD